jgi:DNA-binding NarL/FixJ family response regulator
VIVDDQAVVRAGLRAILQTDAQLEVVGEACDGNEALTLTRSLEPDVVMMDIRMPVLDGIEATRRLAEAPGVRSRILILTTYGLDQYFYEALRAGATGFLLKTDRPDRIIDAVHVVARGDALLRPETTRRLVERFLTQPAPNAAPPPGLDDLTAREHEVLQQVARGLSNHEIAQTLFVSEGTVKTHVARVLAKLGLRDRIQAVVLAYEAGLVRAGQGS